MGQLLYVPGVTVAPNVQVDMLVAATTQDYVLVYNANPPYAQLSTFNLNTFDPAYPKTFPTCNMQDGAKTQKWNGITSTPTVGQVSLGGDPILYLIDKASTTDTSAACNAGSLPPAATFFRLWAIDLSTSNNLFPPVTFAGPNKTVTSTQGNVKFNPILQDQRPGLLVWHNTQVFAAFGGMPNDDNQNGKSTTTYHGWVMSFSSLNGQLQWAWTSTPVPFIAGDPPAGQGQMGGIWQGGNGIMISPSTNDIVVATGNGDNVTANGLTDYGDSIVALNVATGALDHAYVADNAKDLYIADADLASAGPVESGFGTFVHSGKDGLMRNFDSLYNLIDGPFHSTFPQTSSQVPQVCFPRLALAGDDDWPRVYGGPVYWDDGNGNGTFFTWGSKDYPRLYPYTQAFGTAAFNGVRYVNSLGQDPTDMQIMYCDDNLCSQNCKTIANYNPFGVPPQPPPPNENYFVANNTRGAFTGPNGADSRPNAALALSGKPGAAGQGGVLWASQMKGNTIEGEFAPQFGILYAFDPDARDSQGHMPELIDNASETPYIWSKFNPPTVTNGHVYLPAIQSTSQEAPIPNAAWDSEILIYGLTQ
ncbi:MAG TPA: hypothetical protein VKU41_25400 [Polyangiaceae bacterium]|nr:hypothetical protein [Polyangiaceae bacterium]